MSIFNNDSILGYINNPLSREDMLLLYRENNIKIEKCELFGDFALSLIITILDTYLGDDVTNLDDQFKHYDWVWKKTIANFIEEGFDFEDANLYDYYLEFMLETYYSMNHKKELRIEKKILLLWMDVFTYTNPKSNSDMNLLIDIYKIFEKALKNL